MKLISATIVAALVSSLTAPAADACGGEVNVAPRMFLVAHHFGRTFALLGGAVPETAKLDWYREDMTYDRSAVAPAPALATAMQLTLVDDGNGRTLSTNRQVFIEPAFEAHRSMTALELPTNRRFEIAVEGKHTTAWEDIAYHETPDYAALAWAQHPGFTPPLDGRSIVMTSLGKIDLITAYGADGAGPSTYIRAAGSKPVGGWAGQPMGAVTVDGVRYLVLVSEGVLAPIRI
jgi:hypothetical protein